MKGNEYLSFTRKERNGMITLVLILLGITFLPNLLFPHKEVKIDIDEEKLATILAGNEAPVFVDSGRKINRLQNFVAAKYNLRKPKSGYTKKGDRQRKVIEINTADTTAFIDLPGIGSTLASRIVLFRDKLGGFINVQQLGEVYGLKDSVLQLIGPYLQCDATKIRKLQINTAGREELKSHPYIRWSLAGMLINIRSHHGPFSAIDDLKRMENIDDSVLNKLAPYLSFE